MNIYFIVCGYNINFIAIKVLVMKIGWTKELDFKARKVINVKEAFVDVYIRLNTDADMRFVNVYRRLGQGSSIENQGVVAHCVIVLVGELRIYVS